ncbi:hypothetical protein FGO68_gene8886 [Halteria grandinella]|uniref:Uncharacterized protein n=1 Tax=Halteria grandinella TaxID=5974 RepID=A0A8J8NJ75_HALGN|nr:hypothetical protein FGO68_gene8886 [Halteria grandinella]
MEASTPTTRAVHSVREYMLPPEATAIIEEDYSFHDAQPDTQGLQIQFDYPERITQMKQEVDRLLSLNQWTAAENTLNQIAILKKEADRKRQEILHQMQVLHSEELRGHHGHQVESLFQVWEEILSAFHAHANLEYRWLLERQREDMRVLKQRHSDEVVAQGNRLGGGKARPNKEMLTLMTIRERMIVARRFGEIEKIEKQIAKMQYEIQVKQQARRKEDQGIEISRLEAKQAEQVRQLKASKQRELEIMLTKREKDFQLDHQKLLNQRHNLEGAFGQQIAWS